jgi:asparaginyl-tRNA synthetase
MFRVSTLDPDRRPATIRAGSIFSKDFFGKEPNLTVSGQLEAETYCMAFRNV